MAGNPDAEGALGTAGAPVDPPPHKPVVAADYDYIKYLFSKDTEAELLYVLPVDEGGDGGSSSNGSSSPVRRHSEREQALVDVHAQVHATIKSYCASRTVTHHYEDLDQEMVMEYEGSTLAGAMKARGHRVTLISPPEGKKFAEREKLEFFELKGAGEEMKIMQQRLGTESGLQAFQITGELLRLGADLFLQDFPRAVDETKVDALIIDEILYSAATAVAEMKNIPYGTMANAMSIMHSTDTPPFITTWQYSASWWYQLRDSISWFLLGKIAPYVSARRTVNKWRQNNGLSTLPDGAPRTGGLIQVAQQPAFFEFPKSDKVLPQHFFYTSPWHNLGRDTAIPFPFEKLNPDKQLIYASLGTLQNKLLDVYKNICEACVGMENVQLVVALGNEDATIELEGKELPEECIVVGFVPQLQLLRKASLVITHCGMNTCLESLACGLPAIAIPVTNDQPGVAARWRSLGAATVIDSPKEATPDRIQKCITELLPRSSPSSQAAKKLQARLRSESPRLEETAELIEIALNAEFPLVRDDARAIKLLGNRLVEPIMQ